MASESWMPPPPKFQILKTAILDVLQEYALKSKHKSNWIIPILEYKHELITIVIVIHFSKKVTLHSQLKVCI